MTREADLLSSIDRIEAISRRARPIVALGLLAIVIGFAILAYRLDAARDTAEERARTEAAKVVELTTTLEQARRLVVEPELDRARLSEVLGVAIRQAVDLGTTVAAEQSGAQAAPASDWPPVIRIFFHIHSEDQREQAASIARGMANQQINGARIVVPGIELAQGRGDNSLRCLKPVDCRHARELAAWVNRHVTSHHFRTVDLSRAPGNADVAAGTYELWFGAGPIEENAP